MTVPKTRKKSAVHKTGRNGTIQYKHVLVNGTKNISDIRKTMSYVEKITSDIIQTTSDLFFAVANL